MGGGRLLPARQDGHTMAGSDGYDNAMTAMGVRHELRGWALSCHACAGEYDRRRRAPPYASIGPRGGRAGARAATGVPRRGGRPRPAPRTWPT
jgi:hypothetical protein